MAKIFRKTRNPYVLCAVTHSLTLIGLYMVGRETEVVPSEVHTEVDFQWASGCH